MTHRELLETAKRYDYSVIAFADHDQLITREVVEDLRAKPVEGINWISAIEVSSAMPPELNSAPSGEFHIVGLFVDPFESKLLEHCVKVKEGRQIRMKKMVANLNKIGFVLTEEECVRAADGGVVIAPHVVMGINSHPENARVMEQYRKQMEDESKTNPAVRENYEKMMERGPGQYPYQLFLGGDAYVRGIHVPYLYTVNMDESVALIRGAGGLAIVAHYTTVRKDISYEMLDNFLREKRVDGVETIYGFQAEGTRTGDEILEDRGKLAEMAERTGCLVSGGADAHKERDLEYFAEMSGLGDQTVGLAEKIIEKSGVNTSWSSFV
jgi:predicted metal-dependent phosphoesterase TrpH